MRRMYNIVKFYQVMLTNIPKECTRNYLFGCTGLRALAVIFPYWGSAVLMESWSCISLVYDIDVKGSNWRGWGKTIPMQHYWMHNIRVLRLALILLSPRNKLMMVTSTLALPTNFLQYFPCPDLHALPVKECYFTFNFVFRWAWALPRSPPPVPRTSPRGPTPVSVLIGCTDVLNWPKTADSCFGHLALVISV